MRNRLYAALLAAALCSGSTARAHENGYYEYFKWRCTVNYLVCVLVPVDCGQVLCNEHGYEHDPATGAPIPGHQQGESWDCKFPLGINEPGPVLGSQQPPSGAHQAQSAAYAAIDDAASTAVKLMPRPVAEATSPYVDPDGPPPCPLDVPRAVVDLVRQVLPTASR